MRKKVLFVDDEGEWSGPYIRLLSVEFEVVPYRRAEDALNHLENCQDIDCIVLDVMMPTPEAVAASRTDDGQNTGIWLLEQLQEYVIGARCPVIILTNKKLDAVRESVAKLQVPPLLLEICAKSTTKRDMLPIIAGQMIARSMAVTQRR